ncbi:MAG: hypoxanthine phosphoribosyltransferase [Puniceicoccaceae bacterium]|nr:MAG: hypoxanthine phosphoribosyltransferase [Puniceicoccaceae bacterium]|tara:strand:- start:34 stop:612 length:579 start_codon:yes stop_codon:yes gene_type:complete
MQNNDPTYNPLEDIDQIIVTEAEIQARLIELGKEINETYEERDVAGVAIINGAIIFIADLIRQLSISIKFDCIRFANYRGYDKSMQKPAIIDKIRLDLKGLYLLITDNILDSGRTLSHVTEIFKAMQPASLKTCVLLDKKTTRNVDFEADFVGFRIPDEFVVGYGLDFAERYRQLPCIGVLRPELQNPPEWS